MESSTVLKALGLLESLATAPVAKSLAELARELRLTKPTAHRLLKTLSQRGYVERTEEGQYRAGAAWNRLLARDTGDALRAVARPILQGLHRTTGETVNLGVLRHGKIVYLEVLESSQPLRRVATPGMADPFYCTALGRAIAAQLPSQEQDALLSSASLQKRTSSTITNGRQLRQILQQARLDGYAIEVDQTDVGVTCLGVPVYDPYGVAAAVSLSVPTARLSDALKRKWLSFVQKAADQISRRLKAAGRGGAA